MFEPPIKVSSAKSSSSGSSSDSDKSYFNSVQAIPLEPTLSIEPNLTNLIQSKILVQYETEQEIQDQSILEPQTQPKPEQEILTETIPDPQTRLVQLQQEIEPQSDLEQVTHDHPQPETIKDQTIPQTHLNQQPEPSDHHLSPSRKADDMSESGTVALPSPFTHHPTINLNFLPHIKYQMEEFMRVIFDKVQNLVPERLITYDLIAYATKWDTLRNFVDTVLKNMRYFSFESVASSR